MMKNEYRRALILLRGSAQGCSGHVRLERRTIMGSMCFQVQTPTEYTSLRAALAGRDRRGYYACKLGELRRDGRGQAVLKCDFDPRNLCGRTLEQYQLIVVCDEAGEILLLGNVCGHAEMDWEKVRGALRETYEDGAASDTQAEAAQEGATEGGCADEADEAGEETIEEKTGKGETEAVSDEPEPEAESTENESDDGDEAEDLSGFIGAGEESAGDLLALDIDLPWPESAEPLRALFIYSPPLENAPDDEYVYIAADMPQESGYPYVAVGVRVENGAPISLRYALPDRWSEQSPAGMEDYQWFGDGNQGWWVHEIDVTPDGAN